MLGIALVLACLCGCGGSGSQGSPQSSSEARAQQGAPKEQSAEESIEGFGSEAEGSQREEVLGAFHNYLGALAEGDEQAACDYLSVRVQQSLQQLAAKAKKVSCPQLLEVLLSAEADQIARGQSEGKITKVRIKGDTAFIVFHAPGARLYQATLAREGGEWKATSLSASVLAPSLPH